MPRKRKAQAETSVPSRVTYSGWTWQPGDVMPPSNRRALFEPDPRVDSIVYKEMEDIKRLERALEAAGTDPQARDELLGMMVGQNVLHYMSVQPVPSADDQTSAQQPAPQKTKKRARPQIDPHKLVYTLEEAAYYLGMSRAKLYPKVTRGEIASYLDDGQRLITRKAIEAYQRKKSGEDEA